MRYRGRGRPRKLPQADIITPQLRAHHARGTTKAPLDRLLMAGMMDADAHWAGMHLRRLHVALHGSNAPQSGFYWQAGGGPTVISDARLEHWNKEYTQARQMLQAAGQWHACLALIMADESGAQPLVAWEKGAEACHRLAALWCKKSMCFDF